MSTEIDLLELFGTPIVLILSAITAIFLGYLTLIAYRKRLYLRAVVIGMTLVHEITLIVYPVWYSVLTNFYLESEIFVRPNSLLVVYLGEFVFVALFGFGLISRPWGPQNARLCSYDRQRSEIVLIKILAICGAAFYAAELIAPTYAIDTGSKHADLTIYHNIWEQLWEYVLSFIRWPSLIAACLVLTDKSYSSTLRRLGSIAPICRVLFSMINGLRGGIVLVIYLIISAGAIAKNKRAIIVGVITIASIIPFFSVLHSVMRWNTWSSTEGTRNIDMLPTLWKVVSRKSGTKIKRGGDSFLDAWAVRAEGPRNSVGLYNQYDRGNGAGIHPIVGAMVMPIPGNVWPGKPIGGSIDRTNLGAAIYLVQKLKPGRGPQEMGPILASAHAYWEGGWLWLVIAGYLTGLFWNLLLSWGETGSSVFKTIIVLCFMVALPIDGLLSMLNPVYTFILMFWKAVVPLLLLHLMVSLLMSRRFMRNSRHSDSSVAIPRLGFPGVDSLAK